MIMMELKPVTPDILPSLHQLNQSYTPHVNAVSFDLFKWFSEESAYFTYARCNNAIAGFLIAFTRQARYTSPNFLYFCQHYDSFVYIDRIVIDAEFQRSGIGTALYKDLEQYAIDRKISRMACEYNLQPPNEISKQFHTSHGFAEVGQQATEEGKKVVSLQIKEIKTAG